MNVLNAKVGDILSCTWGYSMTLVDFYKVIKVSPSGKSVTVQRLASDCVENADVRGVGQFESAASSALFASAPSAMNIQFEASTTVQHKPSTSSMVRMDIWTVM